MYLERVMMRQDCVTTELLMGVASILWLLPSQEMSSMLKRKRQIKEEEEKEEEEEEDASPVAKKKKTSGKGFC